MQFVQHSKDRFKELLNEQQKQTFLEEKIETFYKKRNPIFKKPLETIINLMVDKCKYINDESLERHNWGNKPVKLKHIPKTLTSQSFEKELLDALNLEENEKAIVELLWGDVQLGKRLHACIVMWISVHILQRPVLYIFRNLNIDQKQLQDDIRVKIGNNNFNNQYVKTIFEKFNSELREYFKEEDGEYWKDYILPEMKNINSNDIINKLNNKNALNSKDIFCCLMNYKQLEKINKKFNEYIYYNQELVDITVLVDESDLMAPTSSNDLSNSTDFKDTTKCEILLAKIYKKVRYTLQITGTAHSLLYNVTTRLNENDAIQIKISQVHKMKRTEDYYGLFNNKISFHTSLVTSWWDSDDTSKTTSKYNIITDYDKNIKNVIQEILDRPLVKYNSLLISEEKIKKKQFCLVFKILQDFPRLFILIYHENCLRLYISKEYVQQIKYWCQWDSNQSSTGKRLWQEDGIYGEPKFTYENGENGENLPNNYCYFNVKSEKFDIKPIYKLIRILFKRADNIKNKTVITITGKYGERGFSFTSDDFEVYSFHLTDQYYVSHASFNCTNGSQQMRCQGKYNDIELKNGRMKLTLWTTSEMKDIMQKFYVKFIKEIEKNIMSCKKWEDIKSLLESIIDDGEFKFWRFMKYIDVSKKRKNFTVHKHFDLKHNGYKLIKVDDFEDLDIKNWIEKFNNLPRYLCEEHKKVLPPEVNSLYLCVNEIKTTNLDNFKKKYGVYQLGQCDMLVKTPIETYEDLINVYEKFLELHREIKENISCPTKVWFDERKNRRVKVNDVVYLWHDRIGNEQWDVKTIEQYRKNITRNMSNNKNNHLWNFGHNSNNDLYLSLRYTKTKDEKILPLSSTDYIHKTPYIVNGVTVTYSVLKEEWNFLKKHHSHGYKNEKGDNFISDVNYPKLKYYWKTPDGWLYLYDKEKPKICSLKTIELVSDKSLTTEICSENTVDEIDEIDETLTEVTILSNTYPFKSQQQTETVTKRNVNNIELFVSECCKKPENKKLRVCDKIIYDTYKTWCKNKDKQIEPKKKFKEELEKLNIKREKTQGVDIHNRGGSRGYNIMVSL